MEEDWATTMSFSLHQLFACVAAAMAE